MLEEKVKLPNQSIGTKKFEAILHKILAQCSTSPTKHSLTSSCANILHYSDQNILGWLLEQPFFFLFHYIFMCFRLRCPELLSSPPQAYCYAYLRWYYSLYSEHPVFYACYIILPDKLLSMIWITCAWDGWNIATRSNFFIYWGHVWIP